METNKPKLTIILLLGILLLAAIPSVSATNATKMSFSDLGLTGPQAVQLYQDGILIGTYNSTDSNITLPDKDFIVVIKPELKTHWFNPGTFISDFFGFLSTYWEQLLLLAVIVGLLIFAGRQL